MPRTRAYAAVAALTLLSMAGARAADWTVESARDPETYRDIAMLQRESTASISDEYAKKQVQPRLQFRCEPGAGDGVHVRIEWLRFISSFNTEVSFAAGDAEPLTLKFGVDRSNTITSTHDSDDDRRLLDYLSGQDDVTVSVTPYSEPPLSVDYELDGLAAGLDELHGACAG